MLIKILSFIIVFTVIVLAHELGHFIFSRLSGIRVLELGMGIGPKIFGIIKNRTKYTLNLFPIGGFVRIAGLDEDIKDKNEAFKKSESFLNKSPWQKFLAIFGGPLFNLLLALLIFYSMFTITGVPKSISNEISMISPRSEASRIGLAAGDRIIAMNGRKVGDMSKAVLFIHENPGKTIEMTIVRSGATFNVKATPVLHKKMKIGLIGFSLKPVYERTNPIAAIAESFKQLFGTSAVILYTLLLLLVGKISLFDLAGPVGIAQFTGQVAGEGIVPLLSFTAFLSVNLGLVNLLPLPALDGGRIVFIIIEKIKGKPVEADLENKIHQIGFSVLLGIMAIVTVNDLIRIASR